VIPLSAPSRREALSVKASPYFTFSHEDSGSSIDQDIINEKKRGVNVLDPVINVLSSSLYGMAVHFSGFVNAESYVNIIDFPLSRMKNGEIKS
jgi:hypothetical protein